MKLFYKTRALSIRLLFGLMLCVLLPAHVTAEPQQETSAKQIFSYDDFVYFVDSDRRSGVASSDIVSADDVHKALQTFKNDTDVIQSYQPPFNVGNTDTYYWFYTRINNNHDREITLRLLAALPYRQLLNAYLIDDQLNQHQILQQRVDSNFTDRNRIADWQHRWQVSTDFVIPESKSFDLVVQYHAVGSSYLPLEVVTMQQLMEKIYDDSVNAALFYSFSIAAILLFLLFGIAMHDRTATLYAGLFSIALLMLAAMEGYAFMYLWPELPRWNHFSALVLVYLFCSTGFYVAANAVEPSLKQETIPSKIIKLLLGLSALSALMAVSVLFLPFILLVNLTNLFVALMFVAHAYAIYTWSSLEPQKILKRNLIAIISAILISLVVIVLVLLSFDISFLPSFVYVHSSRVIFILAGLATMATIISHVSGLRLDYATSLENEVVAAKREAEMNKALFKAEQNYARVKSLASLRQQQLAEASHDMKQPLVSLRSTLDSITQEQPFEVKQQLNNAFSYLENLCSAYLEETRPDYEETTETVKKEDYAVNLVLETVYRMFASEAEQKNIRLRMVPSSKQINAEPTIVIRIIANMVSNALKHAGDSTLLIGVRARDEGLSIVVVDNGSGISAEKLETVTQAYEKGPDSSGEGLGLAICKQLATQHEMELLISSEEGKGVCCQLNID